MPKTIAHDEVRRLLASGDFGSFVDAVETGSLEFKSEPYRLDKDVQKQELAKDVSALANAGGGSILIGFKTKKDALVLGDIVTEVRPIPRNLIDASQYDGVIREWIYPAPEVTVDWLSGPDGKGVVHIEVGAGRQEHVPYLVKRMVSDRGKRSEVVFGYFERWQTGVLPSSVQQIHAWLRSGMGMREIRDQFELLHETLQQIRDGQNAG